jgi:predicted nucleic acid-binding Zn ribbon protein
MDSLSQVLKKLLGSVPALQQGVQDTQILDVWPLAVGELLAKHTRAVQVKGKTLLIEVDHPIWKQELHANKQLALKKLNEKINAVLSPGSEKIWIEEIFLLMSSGPNRNK